MADNSYSEAEMSRMRQDALRRMQDMQRRAQDAGFRPADPPPPAQNGGSRRRGRDIGSLLGSVLGGAQKDGEGLFKIAGIAIDEEKAMIAMLIYILYKQGSDVRLLLALGYLLL